MQDKLLACMHKEGASEEDLDKEDESVANYEFDFSKLIDETIQLLERCNLFLDSKAIGGLIILKRSKFDIPLPRLSGKTSDWNGFHDFFTAALKLQGNFCDSEYICQLLHSIQPLIGTSSMTSLLLPSSLKAISVLLDSIHTPAARELVEGYRSQEKVACCGAVTS